VELADDNGGIVLNVCECGLAMRAVRGLRDDQFMQLRFQLSQSNDWIETRGRIAWMNALRTIVGVEFVDLSYEGQILLQDWIFLLPKTVKNDVARFSQDPTASPGLFAMHARGPENERQDPGGLRGTQGTSADGSPAAADPKDFVSMPKTETMRRGSATIEDTDYPAGSPFALSHSERSREISRKPVTRPGKSGRGTWIWVGATLVLSACFVLAFHLRMTSSNPHPESFLTATKGKESPTDAPGNRTEPSVNPSPPSTGNSFVLQVGAMTHKDNANRLAESLRNGNFPAFVSHSRTDQFYRVLVGPFQTADSASKVQKALQKQNFKIIRKRWFPAAVQDSDRALNQ
jgi:SPOR domain